MASRKLGHCDTSTMSLESRRWLVCAVDDKVVVGSVVPTSALSGILILLEHSLARLLLLSWETPEAPHSCVGSWAQS